MILDMDTLYRIYSNEHDRYWPLRHTSTGTGQPPPPPRKRAGDDRFLGTGPAKKKGTVAPSYSMLLIYICVGLVLQVGPARCYC